MRRRWWVFACAATQRLSHFLRRAAMRIDRLNSACWWRWANADCGERAEEYRRSAHAEQRRRRYS